jgi:hypothetical protein
MGTKYFSPFRGMNELLRHRERDLVWHIVEATLSVLKETNFEIEGYS